METKTGAAGRHGDDPGYAQVRRLAVKPFIAVPALLILIAALLVSFWLIAAVLGGRMSPWLAAVPGALAGYFLFTPIHEAIHRSASNREWVNDLVALVTIGILLPYASPKLLRWGHMQHHRFTNEHDNDPDRMLTGRWYGPLLLWPFFEVFYLPQYLRKAGTRPPREVRQVLCQFVLGLAALALLFHFTGPELFVFWFLSSRAGLWLIVFVFVFLPHHPHDVLQKDDIYGASSLREGHDTLLTVLMAGQNRHLVHHLYPTVPFHRLKAAWEARREHHEGQRPARVSGFGLRPVRESWCRERESNPYDVSTGGF